MFAAVVIAIKYSYDLTQKNDFYARVGGLKLEEFNQIEAKFCELLDFNFFVNSSTLSFYLT